MIVGAVVLIGGVVIASVYYIRRRAKVGHFGKEIIPVETFKEEGSTNKNCSDDDFSIVDIKHENKALY